MNIFNGNTKDFEEYARAGVVEGNYNERQLKYYNYLNGFTSRSLPAAIRSANKSRVAEVFNLFANGEQGAWYDPSDLTTLYQDVAGTTPVTADGDPVGLMLDKSQGLVRGDEMVVNGSDWTGANGSTPPDGWSYGGTLAQFSIIDGALQFDRNGDGANNLEQAITTIPGKAYEVSFDYISDGGGGIFVSPSGSLLSGVGNKKVIFIASSSTSVLGFRPATTATQTIIVDNFSVKELSGNHATQSVAASRPVYSGLTYDGVDDCLFIVNNQSGGHNFVNFDQAISGVFRATVPENYLDNPSSVETALGATIAALRENANYTIAVFAFSFGFDSGRLKIASAANNDVGLSGSVGVSSRAFVSGDIGSEITVGFSINGNDWKLYINGVLDNSGTFTQGQAVSRAVGTATASLTLGSDTSDAGAPARFYNGDIAQGLLIDSVLSAEDMLNLHEGWS